MKLRIDEWGFNSVVYATIHIPKLTGLVFNDNNCLNQTIQGKNRTQVLKIKANLSSSVLTL